MEPQHDGRPPEPVRLVKHGSGQAADRAAPAEGCLVTAIRLPVRIVTLVVVVPVRMVWDVLTACGNALRRTVLRPLGRALEWLWHTLVVVPALAVGKALAWLGRTLVLA